MNEEEKKILTVPEDGDDENSAEALGDFAYTLSKPLAWEGETYSELHFKFGSLTGKQVLDIMRDMRLRGINVAAKQFDMEYQYRYAAACCVEGIDPNAIASLPERDFDAICSRAQRFLVRSVL